MASVRKRNNKWQVQVRRKNYPLITQTFQSKLVNRAVYQDWYKESCGDEILNYFKRNGLTKNSIIFIASGITDNNEGNNLIDVNFMLPRNIFLAIKNEPVTVITFGSILSILYMNDTHYTIYTLIWVHLGL